MLRYKLPTSNQKKISIHLKKSTGCLWARKVWQPSALHEAAVQHLIPTVLLAWKIPYTQEFFWTERGFISAYRPEHRTVSQLEGHPCSKIHTETIWRALTSPRNNFTPTFWETRMALSAAGHSQKSHRTWSWAFVGTAIYVVCSHKCYLIWSSRWNCDRTWMGVWYHFYRWETDSQGFSALLKGHRTGSWRTQIFWCLKLCYSTSSPWPGEVDHLGESPSPTSIKNTS